SAAGEFSPLQTSVPEKQTGWSRTPGWQEAGSAGLRSSFSTPIPGAEPATGLLFPDRRVAIRILFAGSETGVVTVPGKTCRWRFAVGRCFQWLPYSPAHRFVPAERR